MALWTISIQIISCNHFKIKVSKKSEAYFHIGGTDITQNYSIYISESPNVIHDIHLQITVSKSRFGVALLLDSFLTLIFVELWPIVLVTCSVNAQRYLRILWSFIVPELQQIQCLSETHFKQDSALLILGERYKYTYSAFHGW